MLIMFFRSKQLLIRSRRLVTERDADWAAIEPLLPPAKHAPVRVDDRRVLNGIFYILRMGAPWRDLPDRYSPRTTVDNRYIRWAQRGIWKGLFDVLANECNDALIFIDTSIVGAHRAASSSKSIC